MAESDSTTGGDSSGKLNELMRKHPLFSYFFMSYLFSWIMTIPCVLSDWGFLPKGGLFALFFFLKAFAGPTVAAYIMSRVMAGQAGWREIVRRIRLLRVRWGWYLFVLLAVPVVLLAGILVLPGAPASFQGLSGRFLVSYPILFVLIFFGGGPLAEEIGWRGFALPRLQSRYGSLPGTLLLGGVWAFWHLPDFLTTAQRGGPGSGLSLLYINLPIFVVMVVAMAVIFTWVFNNTGGSLFIAMLLHASINTFGNVQALFTAPIVTTTDLPILIAVCATALVIIAATRGRLGYRPEHEASPKPAEVAA
ncbi:MAG TPA: CPBP family intramembrane glutamic endopeptidase [Spirochaetia bacterium]|nr:CPBP family intramembrane glutamic endopeptidase [Spirochaetia bacterium]